MEGVLWYLLASSRGGPTRVRLLRVLDERPRNPDQLADELDLDYTTVRHHLDVFEESGVYDVYCTIHGSSDLSGMSMKVGVGDATIENPLGASAGGGPY